MRRRARDSLTPIASLDERIDAWKDVSGKTIEQYVGDIAEGTFVADVVREFRARRRSSTTASSRARRGR